MSRPTPSRSNLPVLVAETPLAPQPPALVLFGREGAKFRAAWFDAADAVAATTAAATTPLRVLELADDASRDLARLLPRGRMLPSGRAVVPYAKRDHYTRLVSLAGEQAGLSVTDGGTVEPRQTATQANTNADEEVHGAGRSDQSAHETQPTAPASTALKGPVPSMSNDGAGGTDDRSGEPPAPRPGAHLFVGSPKPNERGEIGLGSIVLAHESPDEGWWEAEVIGCNGRVFSLRWCDYPNQPTILRKAGELAMLPPGEP